MGAKIDSAHDYLPLPWDDKATSKELTEEEVNQLMELMRKENEAIAKKEIQKKQMQYMQYMQPTKKYLIIQFSNYYINFVVFEL